MNTWEREMLMQQAARRNPTAYRLKLLAAPTEAPITFADAALHLRLGDPAGAEAGAQQPLVLRMIDAAVGEVQRYCDIALLTQQWRLSTPWLGCPQYLPKAPLQTIDAVIDPNGNTLDPASYRFTVDERLPGILMPTGGQWSFTSTTADMSAEIEFTCGWKTPEDVPAELVQAMLLMVGTWFMHRESAQPFALSVLPEHAGVQQLLDPFRVEVFG